jgi:hypothetical protein
MTRLAGLFWLCLLACASAPAAGWQEGPNSGNSPGETRRSAARPEWEILFDDGIETDEYARQTDYFKIEIGALSKNGKVEYISKVAGRKPELRTGFVDDDERLRIGWKKGNLAAADRKLLAKAGVKTKDKELVHFLSAETQEHMKDLEHKYAARKPEEIRRTRFRIRAKAQGKGYEFLVVEQDPIESRSQNRPARQ